MAGVTDVPFRRLAWRFGAGYVVGEMVSSRAELWDSAKSRLRRENADDIFPHAVQIAGGDPALVAASARRHWQAGAHIIDLNFGCPAKKVCRKAAGSELLKDPELVVRITAATIASVQAPVTVKMRTGWSRSDRNAVALARRLEDAGVAALVVHGRTRECRFLGAAEHDTVARVKAAVQVPVIANGDIVSARDAQRVLAQTHCDGVMIGRGALGQPWLLGAIAAAQDRSWSASERFAVLVEHVADLHSFYGPAGVKIARKHVRWTLQALGGEQAAGWREAWRHFVTKDDPEAQLDELRSWQVAAAA